MRVGAAKATKRGFVLVVLPLVTFLLWSGGHGFIVPGRRAALMGLTPALLPAASFAQVPAWQGSYEDPEHPGCKREVRVEGMQVKIDAAEGKPGCGNGEKEREWSVTGKLSLAAYNEMILDMRTRGGPERVIVTWEGNAIRFPEGNFKGEWIKKGGLP